MMKRTMNRIMSFFITLTMIFAVCLKFPPIPIKANAAQDMVLNINKSELQKVGTQDLSGNACACYATAYCRTILDGYAHSWYEYDANNGNNGESNTWCMWGRGNYYKGYAASQLSLYQQAYNSLNSGRPFIIHVYNPSGRQDNEHWVTIVGYTGVSDYNSLNGNNFRIIDPASSSTLSSPVVLGSSKWALLLTDGYEYCYTDSGSAYNDGTPPSISNVYVSDMDATGYTVNCTVIDESGVDRVQFPTWTLKEDANGNNQDDIVWGSGTPNGNVYSYRVNISDHNNETKEYLTHIYAYDSGGNYSCCSIGVTTPKNDNTEPAITDISIIDMDDNGFTVKCRVTDNTYVASCHVGTPLG